MNDRLKLRGPFIRLLYSVHTEHNIFVSKNPSYSSLFSRGLNSVFLFVCFVFGGESPGCRLFSTASILEWLRNHLSHHSKRTNTERWSRNTLRVVNARVFYVFRGVFNFPLYLFLIQWRRQRHLTWSVTHDVVSRENNLWKSFDHLPAGIEPVSLATKCRVLNR